MIVAKISVTGNEDDSEEDSHTQFLVQTTFSAHLQMIIGKIDEHVNKDQLDPDIFMMLIASTLLNEAAKIALAMEIDHDEFCEMASEIISLTTLYGGEVAGNA